MVSPEAPAGAARCLRALRRRHGRHRGGDARLGFAQSRVSRSECARAERAVIDPGGALQADPTTGAPCVDVPTPAYTLLNPNVGATRLARGLSHSLTLRVDNGRDARYYDASSRVKGFTANPGRDVSLVDKVLY
jgi:hypothetical protein